MNKDLKITLIVLVISMTCGFVIGELIPDSVIQSIANWFISEHQTEFQVIWNGTIYNNTLELT